MCNRRKGMSMAVVFLVVFFIGTGVEMAFAESDYMGLELGKNWLYEITEFEIQDDVTIEEFGTLERQVVAVEVDPEGGTTTYTIRDTRTDNDGIVCHEYNVIKTSSGSYYAVDASEMHLVFETPLQKSAENRFSITSWEEQEVIIWGQVHRDTSWGELDAWLGKEWRQYNDGSYLELTMEFVPYIGFIYEGRLERLFPDGCS